jgi:hypothetical protein
MVFIPGRWLKVILWPLWPIALVYWLRARGRGVEANWAVFDFWVVRGWWAVLAGAFLVGVVSAIVQHH